MDVSCTPMGRIVGDDDNRTDGCRADKKRNLMPCSDSMACELGSLRLALGTPDEASVGN